MYIPDRFANILIAIQDTRWQVSDMSDSEILWAFSLSSFMQSHYWFFLVENFVDKYL